MESEVERTYEDVNCADISFINWNIAQFVCNRNHNKYFQVVAVTKTFVLAMFILWFISRAPIEGTYQITVIHLSSKYNRSTK